MTRVNAVEEEAPGGGLLPRVYDGVPPQRVEPLSPGSHDEGDGRRPVRQRRRERAFQRLDTNRARQPKLAEERSGTGFQQGAQARGRPERGRALSTTRETVTARLRRSACERTPGRRTTDIRCPLNPAALFRRGREPRLLHDVSGAFAAVMCRGPSASASCRLLRPNRALNSSVEQTRLSQRHRRSGSRGVLKATSLLKLRW
jgi:hypothetical protein